MDKKEVIALLKKSIIPIIIIAWITAFVSVVAIKYFKLLPEIYVVQSQLVVNPKISEKEDSVKSMDLLKYNENYSLLVYSSSYLEKVAKQFDNSQFKDPLKLKPKIKVLYSPTSQVLTLQVNMDNEKEGIKLANIMLEELRTEGNKLFSHSDLTVLSKAVTTNKITYSTSLLLMVLSFIFFGIYVSSVLFYKYNQKHKHTSNKKRRR
ncbi:YveK family protein [Enterococcus hirae]|uniref:hypothetical protein n=1 Tax=Enterococcus hirae TaxID=1354 RepID=UPI0006B17BB5|nr:hypothetical protein [Enterococcus hirae]MBE8787343.1 hypothetical protein [Enterococcus hirae]MBE8805848.1 hypothetical protein [Enterococcus hirae]VTX61696.1 polys_exp_MPA1: polysaccharide export protein, MPA1 family [Enterococcus hirae]